MSAQDAMFLHVENDRTPMHIGGVSIFGVTGDRDHAADIDMLTAGIGAGLTGLLERATTVPA